MQLVEFFGGHTVPEHVHIFALREKHAAKRSFEFEAGFFVQTDFFPSQKYVRRNLFRNRMAI